MLLPVHWSFFTIFYFRCFVPLRFSFFASFSLPPILLLKRSGSGPIRPRRETHCLAFVPKAVYLLSPSAKREQSFAFRAELLFLRVMLPASLSVHARILSIRYGLPAIRA